MVDAILGVVKPEALPKRVFAPFGTQWSKVTELQGKGWILVSGLVPVRDEASEAKRVGCTHVLTRDAVKELKA